MAAFPGTVPFEQMDFDEHEPIQMNSGAPTEHFHSHLTISADDGIAKSAEIERLTQELARTRREMELLQKKPRDIIEDLGLDSYCHINIANKDELEKAQLEIQNLRIINEQLQGKQKCLTDELVTKSAEIEELNEELAKTREKSANDHAEATTKMQMQTENIEKLINELDSFKWTINTVNEKLNESNRQMQLSTQMHEHEIKKYSETVRERKDELEKAQLEIQHLRIINEQLQSKQKCITDEVLTKSAEIEDLKEELANTRKKSASEHAEATTKIQRQAENIEKLINELDNFKRTINYYDEKLKESNRQMQMFTQRHEHEIKKYLETVRERDAAIKNLDAYNEGLEKQLRGIKHNLDSSEKKVADLQIEKECLQREIEEYKCTLEKYMAEVHSQTETISLIQEENITKSRSLIRFHEEVKRISQEKADGLVRFAKRCFVNHGDTSVEYASILRTNDEYLKKLKITQEQNTNKNKREIDILKKDIHSIKETLHTERQKWNAEKTKMEQICRSAKEETNRITHAFNTVTQECNAVKEKLRMTQEERDELTMRLSKLASASLTHNNPNIADLSDPYRPTKLSEAFSELYDNEWTDAFEGVKESDERTTVKSLLIMLQKAYEFSIALTNQASKDMGETFTNLSLKYSRGSTDQTFHKIASRHAEKRNADTTEQRDTSDTFLENKSKATPENTENVKSDCDNIGETGSSLSLNGETSESKTKLRKDPHHHEVTAEQGLPVVKSTTDMTYAACTRDDQLHAKDTNQNIPSYVDIAIRVDVDEVEEETYLATVSFDIDKLNPTEKQTIKEIRKRVLHELKDQIVQMIASAVYEEMNLQGCDDSIFTYVKTCASICWEMRIHQPPVCLDFKEIDDRTLFNASIYKHYTKSGPHVDYVVWPAMYLNEGGPLLSKGVAQGK